MNKIGGKTPHSFTNPEAWRVEQKILVDLSKTYKGVTNEREIFYTKCSHCGAQEITKASLNARCMFCTIGRMEKQ